MISDVDIVETVAMPTAVVHIVVARSNIEAVMEPAVHEVLAVLAEQGMAPAGPLFTLHLRIDAREFDFEVGFPLAEACRPSGRVRSGFLPAATVARTTYRGAYEGLIAAWPEFLARLAALGYESGEGSWERYIRGAEADSNPASRVTELNRVIRIGE